ncbi:MAG: hypothetical protein NC341_08905 [Blautia sp.]|nr:hypothetical protein [Blautia sp.]MCM1201785.1 hypothetical protein [Bacteroides fragilis]
MKKIKILLASIGIACVLAGCGRTVELTEEENEIITEYAVGLLLKYDKYYSNHLVELSTLEEEPAIEEEEPAEMPPEETDTEESDIADTPVIDAAEEAQASTIEEFYGIEGIVFQYAGYDLMDEYPDITENSADIAFVMGATDGMKLLVLKFQAFNLSGAETGLNMSDYGTRLRIAVNGESPKSALSTMLPNDLQTYRGTIGAGETVELAAVIEVPEGTSVDNLSAVLRSDTGRTTLILQ